MGSSSSYGKALERLLHRLLRARSVGLALLIPFAAAVPSRGDPQRDPTQIRLDVTVRNESGAAVPARLRVLGSDGRLHPDTLDTERMAHLGSGGFFYAEGAAWVDTPPGLTRLTVGRGFEYTPYDRWLQFDRDTSVVVVLHRLVDLGEQGWFCGDMHAHANHGEPHYAITPVLARRVARAEGLSVLHLFDQWENFSGEPHPLSDGETILFYSFEYRNAASGHIGLPGLHSYVGAGCCSSPEPAYPMLLDIRKLVVPSSGPMIVLAHPHTTDDYFDDEGWPGVGLGREMPVLAAYGALDAIDVASYSNNEIEDWEEWTDIISSGAASTPTAGSDADLNYVFSPPPGGYRLYAQLGAGEPLDYVAWLDAVLAGRTFVTNFPLIPDFEVNGVRTGGTIDLEGDTGSFLIRVHALCALGLHRISLMADGQEIWTALTPSLHSKTELDTTFTIAMPVPTMLCARAEGYAGNPQALQRTPIAQTNAVRFTKSGAPRRLTAACGRMLDRLDAFEEFVARRGGWHHTWEADSVAARIEKTRRFYRDAFILAPNSFALLSPGDRDTVAEGNVVLTWLEAVDPEPGDRIEYTASISSDSSGPQVLSYATYGTSFHVPPLRPNAWYWWEVEATDRGGNVTSGTPLRPRFFVRGHVAGAEGPETPALHARAIPNPSRGAVRLDGFLPPVTIVDPAGRLIATVGSVSDHPVLGLRWDGRTIGGEWAPPGLYWARGRESGRAASLIRIR